MEQLQSSLEGFWPSPQQKRTWLLGRSGPVLAGQGVILAEGPFDPRRLGAALARVLERHEILRTTFRAVSGMAVPLQVVEETADLVLRTVDWTAGAPEVPEDEALDTLLREEREADFDFEEGPLVRFCLLALGARRHALVVTLPSVCADAASLENLVGEIGRAYLAQGGVPSLQEQEEAVQYVQFSEWQNEILSDGSEEGEPGRRYWRSRLEPIREGLRLPFERETEAVCGMPRTLRLAPCPELAATLAAWAAARGVAESSVLLAAWWGTLCRLTGSDELRVSVQCHGRAYEEMLGALGLYERWPALGRGLRSGFQFSEVVDAFSREVGDALAWQELYGPETPDGGTPGGGGFGFEYATGRGEPFQAGPVRFSLLRLDGCTERFKLRLAAARGPRGLALDLCFDPGLFEDAAALRLAESFFALLTAGLAAPTSAVQELAVLGGTELGLFALWNRTACPRPEEERLHELFSAQARRTPEAPAVLASDARLTFAELDRRANRIAWFLAGLGIGPDDRVALCLERSADAIAALLGILKAGGAYVPVDPAQPGERLAGMLSDAGARVVLSQGRLAARVPAGPWRTVLLDAESETLERHPAGAPPVRVTAEHLAYVIYTSGSTGRPKGTLIQHRSVANLLAALDRAVYRRLGAGPWQVSVNAPLYFDASVKQWIRLLRGDALVLVPEALRTDAPALLGWLDREQVDVLDCTPSLLRLLLGAGLPGADGAPRALLIGGEAIDAALWETLAADPRRRSFNVYGPTECTVDAAVDEIAAGRAPALGRAIGNVELYVLGGALDRRPLGSPGELTVGGDGLARGYLGRPDLTAERFVPDPYGGRPGGRLYRTGDRARFLPDGRVEFLGRLDHQVKLRGVRIELGEIEAALSRHPGVGEAVALLREDQHSHPRLVAYAVERDRDAAPAPEELREHLRALLPDAMVPAACVVLREMPLTRNGKIDRGALPAPEEVASAARERLAPRTPVEEILVGTFAEVLDIGRPGADESFFDLGGHSLLATQLVARVRESFRIDLPLRVLFEDPTAAALGRRIEAVLAAGDALEAPPLQAVPRDGKLPLSFAQQRLWFLWHLDPGSPAYNNPKAMRIHGPLQVAAVAQTLAEIVRRHEVLRTTFPAVQGEPVQRIDPAATLPVPLIDLSALPAAGREALAHRLFLAGARRPFDLACEVPVRAQLLRLGAEEHLLLLTFHHIACDAWSLAVLEREVAVLYEAFAAGRASPLPELPVQYADFACWQRGWLRGEVLERQLAAWRSHLDGALPVLELPLDRPRPAVSSAHGRRQALAVPAPLARALAALSQRRASTLFMTLLAGFQALLSRLSGQQDVSVGTPIAGRRHVETEGLIGFFVNTLVLRGRLAGDPAFEDLLAQARETALQAYAHQDLPFERLVDELAPRRDMAHTPLFQALLVLQNVGRDGVQVAGLDLSSLAAEPGVAKFDLTLSLAEGAEGLLGGLEYRTELFDAATVARFGHHLVTLLEGAVAEPKARLSELPLLTAAERHHLLCEWNDAAAALPEATLHGLVEAQVERSPDAVAVVYAGESLTYRALDRRATALACRLRAHGVGSEDRVGLCAERSIELVVGLLGILKAGGAWVPFDPEHPDARLAQAAADARCPVLLVQAPLRARLEALLGAGTCLLDPAAGDEAAEGEAEGGAGPDHTAYAIFTSGSTGRPKGAANTHRGIVNRLLWMQDAYGLTAGDRILQKTPFSFDVSVWELFWPLITGARLVLAEPGGHRDPAYLARTIAGEGITCLHFVPSMLRAFLDEADLAGCASLRMVMASGEALPLDLAGRFHERLGGPFGVALHNLYGPTEAAVDVTFHAAAPGAVRLPIGRPVANTRIHLLDAAGGLVPPGVAGELYIGGVQVGRGYLGRPELTADRFVPDPFGPPGSRLYRTGDRARHLPDGAVEYLGRLDHQVKVRGVRIELGEIEAALAQHPAVHESVVVARDGAHGTFLAAYVVPEPGREAAPGALRDHLADRLPEPMVPTAWVVLDALPLLPNGKLDRRALPAPGRAAPAAGTLAPRTPVEEIVAGIFATVLGVEVPGVEASFFELGGHSLLATRVMARVRAACGVDLPLRALFEAPSAAALARRIEVAKVADTGPDAPPIQRAPRDRPLPLSFAQQRLWFLWQLEPAGTAYHVPLVLRIRGHLDVASLERTLGEIVRRHEALRTTFPAVEGEPVQVVDPAARLALPLADLSDVPAGKREELAQRAARAEARGPFDLARELPVRAKLLRFGAAEHVLLLTFHHIVSDAWSLTVLEREMAVLYEAFAAGRPSPLPELPVQYADFAQWQRGWLQGAVLERQLAFWREHLAGAPPVLDLPLDRPRPAVASPRAGRVPFVLPAPLAGALAGLGRERSATLFMTLLVGFQALLARYSGQPDVCVGTPIAGRRHLETEGLIGFFVNTLVLRGRMEDDPAFGDLLDQARETALQAYAHQDLPFERLVDELAPQRDLAGTPLFQVMLVLQNVMRADVQAAGLELSSAAAGPGMAKLDLTLTLAEGGGGLHGGFDFRACLFDPATVARLGEHLATLLEGAVADPRTRLSDLPLLAPAEHRQLLAAAQGEAVEIPEVTLAGLVEAQTGRTPDAVAVICSGASLTYRELDRRAAALAHRLRALGVGPEARVGLCAERSLALIVGLLGILKAGGAWVPLDPGTPDARLAQMIEDARPSVLLAPEPLRERLAALAGDGIRVMELAAGDAVAGEMPALDGGAGPDHAAYVIFTSGSTGRPKGAVNTHRGIVNRLFWFQRLRPLTAADRVLQKTPIGFDVSVWELFWPLLAGARLVMARPGAHRDPAELARTIAAEGITCLHFVPSMLRIFLEESDLSGCAGLRRVLASGEALPPDLAESFHARLGSPFDIELHNLYGPTETAVEVSWHLCPPGAASIPIGRPVDNVDLLVLERHGALAPVGVRGELHIGGVQVGRGYLGRPDLTAERFVPDPFGPPGARLYRTGDLARQLPDGAVEYLGRLDQQVKVRGVRIEPAEIEAALAQHPAVRDAAVVARSGESGPFLAAWVVPQEGREADPAALRDHLRQHLPEPMVPVAWAVLEALPLLPSGKLDRRALPDPHRIAGEAAGAVAPRTPVEEMVAGIFATVLGVEVPGVEAGFFELGGHSLLATRVMARMRAACGVDLPLRALFEHPTARGFAREVEAALRSGAGLEAPPLRPVPREGDLPASFAQQRLWLIDRLEPGSALYNMPSPLRLRGLLDAAALRSAFDALVRRHETLRTRFAEVDGTPLQVIDPPAVWSLTRVDLSALPGDAREEEARRLARAEAARPFDLACGPVLRTTLLRLAAEEHVLLLDLHHIAGDGWSMEVLSRELAALYRAARRRERPALPELPVQYADFAVWQREWLTGEVLAREVAYWRGRLAEGAAGADLPTDRPRAAPGRRAGRWPVSLPEAAAEELAALSRSAGTTLFMTLLAAWTLLLSRAADDPDVRVGTPIAGRRRLETEGLIGFFVNTLVLRTECPREITVRALLERVRETALQAYAHQDLPFEKLVEELQPERHLSRVPLFQALFALQAAPAATPELDGLRVDGVAVGVGLAKFDLGLFLARRREALAGQLEFDAGLFDAPTAGRMAGHLEHLLTAFAGSLDRRLDEVPLLSAAELHQLTEEWNDAAGPFERESTVHALVAAQAARAPEAPAVIFGVTAWSYGELERRAHRLAHALLRRGVTPEARVGVLLERSAEMVLAFLAILEAGGAYVPLDLAAPRERLSLLAREAGLSVLVCDRATADRLDTAPDLPRLLLDEEAGWIDGLPDRAPEVNVAAESLAYVMYTSGSTGVPKGVAISHRAILRLLRHTSFLSLAPGDRVAQASNAAFDAATLEIWGPLLHGATLVGIPRDVLLSSRELAEQIRRDRVDVLFLTTSLFHQIAAEAPEALAPLRDLLFGGEAADPARLRALLAAGCAPRLVNGYGPTECTTFAAWHAVRAVPPGAATVPIGRPLTNTRLLVLDRALHPVPAGVPGELYLGGDGLARGYFGRPELTAGRFVPDPFASAPGDRLYRTGDLCRRTAGGLVEYLGRLDGQVKIRGFRIEPGEIEAALQAHPAVRRAVVLACRDAGSPALRLVAWVVAEPGAGGVSTAELRHHLGETLPSYMLPAAVLWLEELPLTPNGKLDHRSLPDPAPGPEAPGGEALAAPRTPVEELVAAAWTDLLGLHRAGLHDDFFALGGHSLLATRLLARLHRDLGTALPLRTVFENPTVAGLARRVEEHLRSAHPSPAPPLVRVARPERLPLSFAQQRLWFLDRLEPGSAAYNIPLALRLEGALDPAAFAASLDAVVVRHEVLRTVFREVDGEPVQVVEPAGPRLLPLVDLSALPEAARRPETLRLARAEARRPFDLAAGPVLRASLVRLGAGEHHLLATLHHVAGDGWSLGLLARDAAAFYRALCAHRPPALPDLPVQYADFAVWQRRWLQGAALEAELAHWRDRLRGAPALLELPVDRPRPAVPSRRGGALPFTLSADLTAAVHALGRAAGATPFMVLLASFQLLLGRFSGQDDVSVGAPIAGRTRVEVEGLVGFFVNTLVLRTGLGGEPGFGDLLARVRETCLDAHLHQDVPFEKLVEELEPRRSLARPPLFQAMLAFQNLPEPGADGFPGLRVATLSVSPEAEKLDLTLTVRERDGGLSGVLSYARDLFDPATAERMLAGFRELLGAALADPAQRVADLPLLAAGDLARVLKAAAGPVAPRPARLLHELFEESARRTPDAVAVSCAGAALTYAALEARSNRLAHHLRGLGVGVETRVGICLERSLDLLVALLGVLKAGGAWVPLDPSYPPGWLDLVLRDAAAPVVVTSAALAGRLPEELPLRRLVLDAAGEALEAESPAPLPRPGSGENAAYLLYTSGSTGRPKGVLVPHAAIVNHMLWMQEAYPLEPVDRVLQKTPFGFDASIWEVFLPLLAGARVIFARPGAHQDPEALVATLAAEEVTVLQVVPSLLRMLLEVPGLERCTRLRRLFCGGEPLPLDLVEGFWSRSGAAVINLYGPTEAAIDATAWTFAPGAWGPVAPLGAPIANVRVLVLDRAQRPVPPGVSGELCIAGAALARGYHGRPDATAERFVPDAGAAEPGARLYRTGDAARRRADGTLEFLGRLDRQVKLRGFRIELEEIEAALRRQPGVREAAVVLQESGEGGPRLVACVVPVEGEPPAAEALLRGLLSELPKHMVPAALALRESLPRTPSGKLDRRRLAGDLPPLAAAAGAVLPRDPVELALCRIAAEVLGVPRVGVRDDFFTLGGHSLLAVRFLARVRRELGTDLPLSCLFESPSVEGLAAAVRRRDPVRPVPALVEIQGRGSGLPLFCVHPIGGQVLCYTELARTLGPDQPFYGLQTSVPSDGSLAERAAEYLREVRTVQPDGPVRLAGWSMGGVLAFEMARQLRERGDAVETLLLLDATAPGHASYPRSGEEGALLLEFARDIAALGGLNGQARPALGEIARSAPEEAVPRLLRLAREHDLLPADLEEEDVRRWFTVFRSNHRAMVGYRPAAYPGRLVLLRAAEGIRPGREGDLGWGRLALGGAEVRTVPGHHYSLLREPHVGALARTMAEILQGTHR